MKKSPKVVLSCAVTGAVHTPTMSGALPYSAEAMVSQSLDAAAAGAAILHLHARDPATGEPSADAETYLNFVPSIAAGTDAIINITTGGSTNMTMDERLAGPQRLSPELASLNMGSMNFVFAGVADKYTKWAFEWEEDYVRGSADRVFSNTFNQIEHTLTTLGKGGTRFEFECYDVSHLYTLAHFADRGLVKAPFLIQLVFGVLGGMGADVENYAHLLATAERLFGEDYYLSAFAAGKSQFRFAAQSLVAGGHVRVGLEDSLYIGPGKQASSNADQVRKAAELVKLLDRDLASADEARELLCLKGRDQVDF